MSPPALAKLDSTLGALADPTRRQVIDLLRERPHRAGELAARLETSPPALSRHLKVLRKSGLVEEKILEDDARVHVYHLRAEPFRELQQWIEHVQALWDTQLDAFAAFVDKERIP